MKKIVFLFAVVLFSCSQQSSEKPINSDAQLVSQLYQKIDSLEKSNKHLNDSLMTQILKRDTFYSQYFSNLNDVENLNSALDNDPLLGLHSISASIYSEFMFHGIHDYSN